MFGSIEGCCKLPLGKSLMELTILIVGLLLLGSQIPGNAHIMLR